MMIVGAPLSKRAIIERFTLGDALRQAEAVLECYDPEVAEWLAERIEKGISEGEWDFPTATLDALKEMAACFRKGFGGRETLKKVREYLGKNLGQHTDLTALAARIAAGEQVDPALVALHAQAGAVIAGLLLGHVALSDLAAFPEDLRAAADATMRKYRTATTEPERTAAERDAKRVTRELVKHISFGLALDSRLAKTMVDGMAAQ